MLRATPLMTGFLCSIAWAAVPASVTQQGRLLDRVGNPMTGSVTMVFSVYATATGGSSLWTETLTVPLDNGYFSVRLGVGTAFGPTVWTGEPRFIGVRVNTDPEMTPREPVASVPFALVADDAVGDLHPTSVTVNGVQVIRPDGTVNAPHGSMGYAQSPAAVAAPVGNSVHYPLSGHNVGAATKCHVTATGWLYNPIGTSTFYQNQTYAIARPQGGSDIDNSFGCYFPTAPGAYTTCSYTTVVSVTPNGVYDFGCRLQAAVANPRAYCAVAVDCH